MKTALRMSFVLLLASWILGPDRSIPQASAEWRRVGDIEKRFVGQRTSELLDYVKATSESIVLIEEPPCKLQGFLWYGSLNGHPFFVEARFKYDNSLFSKTGKWSDQTIRTAIIKELRAEAME